MPFIQPPNMSAIDTGTIYVITSSSKGHYRQAHENAAKRHFHAPVTPVYRAVYAINGNDMVTTGWSATAP